MEGFYKCGDILSKKDINGNVPELLICVGNRTGGKTTSWGRLLMREFLEGGKQFMLLYRYAYELDEISEKFFANLKPLFFPQYEMCEKSELKGSFVRLYVSKDGGETIPCGFATALNKSNQVKKYSHIFSDVGNILFDEFQPEDDKYTSNEVNDLLSIHTSVARGRGVMRRYVRTVLVSNPVNILNPYYSALRITERLRKETKYIRGDGFVFEQLFNEDAAHAIADSGITRAFKSARSARYLTQLSYLNENNSFFGKPEGRGFYMMSLHYSGEVYGLYTYPGCLFVSTKADVTNPVHYSASWDDHSEDTIAMPSAKYTQMKLQDYFNHGNVRFQNAKCKEAFLCAVAMRSMPK